MHIIYTCMYLMLLNRAINIESQCHLSSFGYRYLFFMFIIQIGEKFMVSRLVGKFLFIFALDDGLQIHIHIHMLIILSIVASE